MPFSVRYSYSVSIHFRRLKLLRVLSPKQLSGSLLLFCSMNKTKIHKPKERKDRDTRKRQRISVRKRKRIQIARQNLNVIRKLRVVAFKFIHKNVCGALLYGDDD